MMSERERELLIAALKKEMPEYEYKFTEVIKENDRKLEAVWISGEHAMSAPLFYPADYNGMSCEEMAKQMKHTMQLLAETQDSLKENLLSPEYVYSHVQIQLLNTRRNREYLKDKPHLKMNSDLSAIFFFKIGLYGNAKGTLTEELIKALKLDLSKLKQAALQNMWNNTQLQYLSSIFDSIESDKLLTRHNKDMPQIISELQEGKLLEPVVISNQEGMYGAASILCEQFQKACMQDLIVLPSSTHEMILLPNNGEDLRKIQATVKTVNADICASEDILSDNVYLFDSKTKSISLACDKYGYVPICNDTKLQFPQIFSKKF